MNLDLKLFQCEREHCCQERLFWMGLEGIEAIDLVSRGKIFEGVYTRRSVTPFNSPSVVRTSSRFARQSAAVRIDRDQQWRGIECHAATANY